MAVTASLIQHSIISSRSSTAGNGTGHGADTLQVARIDEGWLYATWLDDTPTPWPDPSAQVDFWRHTHIAMSLDDGATWQESASFRSGQESGYLFVQENRAKLICYPDGLPSLWDDLTDTVTPIPGDWQTRIGNNEINGWWYGGVGVGADDTVFLCRAKVNPQAPYNKPCVYQCQSINPDGTYGGFWETQPLEAGRYGYGCVFPQPDGTALMVGELALTGSEAGYPNEAYVWTDPALLRFDPVAKTVTVVRTLYHGTQRIAGLAPYVIVADALELPGGDLVIAYAGIDGLYPNWFSAISRVSPHVAGPAAVLWITKQVIPYGNIVRMLPLSDGSVLVANLFPNYPNPANNPILDKPCLAYATLDPLTGDCSPATFLPIPADIPLDWSAATQNEFSLTTRNGSTLPTDELVLKFSMGPGATEHFFRFGLSGSVPVPVPQPSPDPVLAARVTALEARAKVVEAKLAAVAKALTTSATHDVSRELVLHPEV